MSERTHDPIQQLEKFESGALRTAPLAPAEVRRLGDRRRARRNAGVAALSVVAMLAAAGPVALLANRGSDAPALGPLTASPTATATPTGQTPQVITYPGRGVEVVGEGDVGQLTGTTPEFRAFVAGQARKAATDGAACPDASHGITVQKYSSAGYALGGVNACGGYAALWVERDGAWQEGLGTQDAWDCDALGYLDVPGSFVGECANEAGNFGPDAVDDLRLGMSRAEVEAAGGSLQAGSAGGCLGLLLPYRSPVPEQVDGWFSPTSGLVGISARPGMKTPERVGLGSSRAAVEAAYPGGSLRNGYWVVPLAHGAEYQIGLESDGTVGELTMALRDQQCFG
jgi:hypothetical protein